MVRTHQKSNFSEPRTVLELKQWLTDHNIRFPSRAKKDELIKLYKQSSSQSFSIAPMLNRVREIVRQGDLDSLTNKQVLQQLCDEFPIEEVSAHKQQIRDTIRQEAEVVLTQSQPLRIHKYNPNKAVMASQYFEKPVEYSFENLSKQLKQVKKGVRYSPKRKSRSPSRQPLRIHKYNPNKAVMASQYFEKPVEFSFENLSKQVKQVKKGIRHSPKRKSRSRSPVRKSLLSQIQNRPQLRKVSPKRKSRSKSPKTEFETQMEQRRKVLKYGSSSSSSSSGSPPKKQSPKKQSPKKQSPKKQSPKKQSPKKQPASLLAAIQQGKKLKKVSQKIKSPSPKVHAQTMTDIQEKIDKIPFINFHKFSPKRKSHSGSDSDW